MKVSIITPCYNASPYIANTIASVQAQTLVDWEMLIIDDGSTDNSANIIRQVSTSDNRVKLIQKSNGGSASARNIGLSLAKGEYIQFLDADDTLAIDKLERQTTLMEKGGLEVSYTDFYIMNADGSIQEKALGKDLNLSKLLVGWGPLGTIPPHAFLYHHNFLKKNNISFTTDIREREDWDFHIKVFSAQPIIRRMTGYYGAYYFLCPTGKTTSGNQEKVRKGTVRYLQYKIQQMNGTRKFLLLVRLSMEFIAITRCIMRKTIQFANICPLLALHKSQMILAIALLPISLPIYTYTWMQSRKKNNIMIRSITHWIGQICSYILPVSVIRYWDKFKTYIFNGYMYKRFKYITPSSSLSRHTIYRGEQYISIGKNTAIGDYSMLTAWDNYPQTNQNFTPNITIGCNCNIGAYSHITAIHNISIGDNVLTGPRVLITDNAHGEFSKDILDRAPVSRPLYSKGEVIIEDNVWIGEGAMIMPNIHIGEGSIIAANSVVTSDIPPYSIAVGIPARVIKQVK